VIATGGDTTLPIAMLNANKRAVTLNLKSTAGKDLLKQMVTKADVLLENFSPGTLDGLGVGYDVLKDINPRLVYATGTGFGITGPDGDNLAMNFTIQAASDIMSVTGDPVAPVASPSLGQHNDQVYGDWLGLGATGVAALRQQGAI
jgi:crotonobetainyl-CoA:carnitine CoA-transferase CaiB-like acyl-CoA transferase